MTHYSILNMGGQCEKHVIGWRVKYNKSQFLNIIINPLLIRSKNTFESNLFINYCKTLP